MSGTTIRNSYGDPVGINLSELPALLAVGIGFMVGDSLLASWWRDYSGPDGRD